MLHARKDYDRIQDPAGLIPDDEPVFLVRAKDKCFAATVTAWIVEATERGASQEMIVSASAHLGMAIAWQGKNETKVPDMPADASRFPG